MFYKNSRFRRFCFYFLNASLIEKYIKIKIEILNKKLRE